MRIVNRPKYTHIDANGLGRLWIIFPIMGKTWLQRRVKNQIEFTETLEEEGLIDSILFIRFKKKSWTLY